MNNFSFFFFFFFSNETRDKWIWPRGNKQMADQRPCLQGHSEKKPPLLGHFFSLIRSLVKLLHEEITFQRIHLHLTDTCNFLNIFNWSQRIFFSKCPTHLRCCRNSPSFVDCSRKQNIPRTHSVTLEHFTDKRKSLFVYTNSKLCNTIFALR